MSAIACRLERETGGRGQGELLQ